jgi:hypothetical protein
MIGGFDIVMPSTRGVVGLDFCLHAIRQIWPNAVFEDARSDKRAGNYSDLRLEGLDEVFVYCDAAAAARWDELGAEPELANTMVHVLCSSKSITVVVDDPSNDQIAAFLSAIRIGLAEQNVPARSSKRAA